MLVSHEIVPPSKHTRKAPLVNIVAMRCHLSRDPINIYPGLHGELLLSMRAKPAEVDTHTGLFAVLRIYVTNRTDVCHSVLAAPIFQVLVV